MQKIYVLLRNDRQTGPYSLEEIIQFDLKPYDLIWIEGKSAGWYYPQEIASLHPYLDFLPQPPKASLQNTTTAKKVFVSMPAVPKQEEAKAAPVADLSMYAPKKSEKPADPEEKRLEEAVYASFTKPVVEKAASYTTITTNEQKTPTKKPMIPVGGAILGLMVVGGIFAASWIMNRHPAEEQATASVPATEAPAQNEITPAAVAPDDHTNDTHAFSTVQQKQQKNKPVTKEAATTVKQTAAPKQNQVNMSSNPAEETRATDAATPQAKEEAPVVTKGETNNTQATESTDAPQEKKKKLRDKIFDIFHKKSEEPKIEEAKPSETDHGERRASHRESGANLTQLVSVRFTIPNDWMMGVKSAKATLYNRSNETVTKATVEVLYYDDDNQLLQKKVISFGKVSSKDSQTISIPDHPSATRVDYNMISVAGQPAA